jgi:hypothetical protein
MKLIFLIFRSRYRYKDLGNFLHSKIYKNFILINLSGFLSIFGRILIYIKVGRGISLDGDPIISDKLSGINIWFGGSSFKIPRQFKNLDNNYVNMKNIFFPKDNLFRFFPINIKKFEINENLKIIFVSKVNIDLNYKEKNIWQKYKKKILNNFLLIDSLKFWKQNEFIQLDREKKFLLYRKFKNLIKYEAIKFLKKKFDKKLIIIGSDWRKYNIQSFLNNYDKNQIKNMYNGNICIDFGSTSGSVSLYARSIQILESGGLLLQAKQKDSNLIWSSKENKILFKSINDVYKNIIFFMQNERQIINMASQIAEKFKNPNRIDINLRNIFN